MCRGRRGIMFLPVITPVLFSGIYVHLTTCVGALSGLYQPFKMAHSSSLKRLPCCKASSILSEFSWMCCVYDASSNVCFGTLCLLSIRSCFCLSFSRSLSACLETHSAILKDLKQRQKEQESVCPCCTSSSKKFYQ